MVREIDKIIIKNMLGGHGTYVPNMLGRLRVKLALAVLDRIASS